MSESKKATVEAIEKAMQPIANKDRPIVYDAPDDVRKSPYLRIVAEAVQSALSRVPIGVTATIATSKSDSERAMRSVEDGGLGISPEDLAQQMAAYIKASFMQNIIQGDHAHHEHGLIDVDGEPVVWQLMHAAVLSPTQLSAFLSEIQTTIVRALARGIDEAGRAKRLDTLGPLQ